MLPMVACVISLVSPTVIPEKKSLTKDLGGSLRLPQIGILQIRLKYLNPWYPICHRDQTVQMYHDQLKI